MIDVVKVKNRDEGNLKAHDILKKIVDSQTLLALSGGTSPNYKKMLVDPGDIIPGAICIVDERYGEEFHKNSNELLFKKQGVFDFVHKHHIEIAKVLSGKGIEETAGLYNQVIGKLFNKFPKRVGVMGVGTDAHTAGIFPNSIAAHSADYVVAETVDDKFIQRITLTFKAIGEFGNFVVLMFGEDKKKAIRTILDENQNDMQKYPAVFYRKAPAKVFLIKDIDIKQG